MPRYHNVSLRVTGLSLYPFSRATVENGTVTFQGLAGYALSLLHQSMGFQYTTHLPPDNVWGGRNADGVWAGQLGMIARNEADIAVGPVTPTEDRFSVAEPLPHYFETTAGHAAGRLVSFRTNVSGHIGGFDTAIWLIIAALVVVLSLGLSLRGQPKTLGAYKSRLYDYVFEMLGNLVLEASPKTARDPHIRIVIAFWWLMLIVLMNTFTGHMKASMTVQEELPKLDSVQDVVDHPDVIPVIIRGSTFEEVFKESTRRDHRLLRERAQRMQSVLLAREIFTKSMFDDVLAGRKVIFLDMLLFQYWVGRFYERLPRGEFYMAREAVMYPCMCMWLNRNVDPQLARVIHIRTRWITESGLPARWKHMLIERSRRKSGGLSDSQGQPLSTASSLDLQDVAAVLQLLCDGLCAALVAFLAELAVSRVARRSGAAGRRRQKK